MKENKLEDIKGFAALLRLVRPKQWIKNGFIFLPLFFGGALLHTDALQAGLITFFAYSFAASSIYCFNGTSSSDTRRLRVIDNCSLFKQWNKLGIGTKR